nr:uncharacterized protein LOC104084929 [Nicotiana tomentosiformis]
MQANDKVIPKARSLFGFNNSSVVTKREVVLATFVEGVIKDTKFQMIIADMTYSIILERPWIHDMDVVPSTLHQVIKFPSQWGIRQIREDQQASRSINSVVITDVNSRPDVIQEPEENENIKTTMEELEAVILFVPWYTTGGVTHKLNKDPLHRPVKQNKRKQGSIKNQVIQDEVQKLLKIGSIRVVKYPDWLANTVVVPKKN